MKYLLDTNIISEAIKDRANQHVVDWLSSIDIEFCSLSVLTLGEIRKGVEKLSEGRKKQHLVQWLEIELIEKFHGRILKIDADVADKWGFISAQLKISMPAIDTLIAATALVHNHKLVTRNIKDFINIPGLELVNPFE